MQKYYFPNTSEPSTELRNFAAARIDNNTHAGPWASEGGSREGQGLPLDFEMFSKKSFFQFRGVKTKFHHFCPPPGKNPSDAHVQDSQRLH